MCVAYQQDGKENWREKISVLRAKKKVGKK